MNMGIMVIEVYDALIAAGAPEEKAKAAAAAIPVGQHLASKNDVAEFRAEMAEFRAEMDARLTRLEAGVDTRFASVDTRFAEVKAEMANEFKALYRHLWLMAAGIVALTVTLVKFIP
jgi:hypothetical protein